MAYLLSEKINCELYETFDFSFFIHMPLSIWLLWMFLNVIWILYFRPNVTSVLGLPEDAVTCHPLSGNGNIEIDMRNACDGYWTIGSCPPLYVSVQLTATTGSSLPSICPGKKI